MVDVLIQFFKERLFVLNTQVSKSGEPKPADMLSFVEALVGSSVRLPPLPDPSCSTHFDERLCACGSPSYAGQGRVFTGRDDPAAVGGVVLALY